mmetsp:Transcript_30849/g.62526  ORF Transcript_30849/g.62526 Transcript_30849/m.62526 type:complete len:251 (+) Transcript_30849:611-1363(+)
MLSSATDFTRAVHWRVAVRKAPGWKRPPSQTVLAPRLPLAAQAETSSASFVNRWRRSPIHGSTFILGGTAWCLRQLAGRLLVRREASSSRTSLVVCSSPLRHLYTRDRSPRTFFRMLPASTTSRAMQRWIGSSPVTASAFTASTGSSCSHFSMLARSVRDHFGPSSSCSASSGLYASSAPAWLACSWSHPSSTTCACWVRSTTSESSGSPSHAGTCASGSACAHAKNAALPFPSGSDGCAVAPSALSSSE